MASVVQIALTEQLQSTSDGSVPVWNQLAWNRFTSRYPESDSWIHSYDTSQGKDHSVVVMSADRNWMRGVCLDLRIQDEQPDVLQLAVRSDSRLAKRIPSAITEFFVVLGIILGVATYFMGDDQPGQVSFTIAAHVLFCTFIMTVVGFVAGFVIGRPLAAVLRWTSRLPQTEADELLADVSMALGSDELIAGEIAVRERAKAAADEERSRQTDQQDVHSDIEIDPDDYELSRDDLQRKHGYSKGNHIYRTIHGER